MSRPARIAWKRKAECIASRTASLPRKAKLRLEIPPLVRAPGQRSLISGSASRKDFAKPRCSSMPVATARTFGSKIRSSGGKPTSSTRSRYARSQIATLRSAVSAWPFSSNAITTTPAPWRRTARACSRNGSSPSLSESELTTPLPWTHLSPASSTDQRELSIMIGIRATSGSVATRLRKVVIARSPSSRSASMFTSSRLAPPRTCSSATSAAAWPGAPAAPAGEAPGLDEGGKAARARDVRPLADQREVGVRPELERLQAAEAGPRPALGNRARRHALDRGRDLPDVLGRRPAAAADNVHEPVPRELPEVAARVLRQLVVEAEFV